MLSWNLVVQWPEVVFPRNIWSRDTIIISRGPDTRLCEIATVVVGKRAYGSSRSSIHYLTENFCSCQWVAVRMTSQTTSLKVVTLSLTGFSGDECWQTRGETGLQRNIRAYPPTIYFLYISSLRLLSKSSAHRQCYIHTIVPSPSRAKEGLVHR